MSSIREVQAHISGVLREWADIMLDIEAHEKAHLLHYSEQDLVNAMYIFEHVLANIAIHNGSITPKNVDKATEMGIDLREYVKKYTGLDTSEIAKR
jgi:hypothetical protein